VKKIAEVLSLDPDELLARAGRVASDLTEIIRRHPREAASFLRSTGPNEWRQLREKAHKTKDR
jgi:hypothetical protein